VSHPTGLVLQQVLRRGGGLGQAWQVQGETDADVERGGHRKRDRSLERTQRLAPLIHPPRELKEQFGSRREEAAGRSWSV
jgi:hypothetical protein